MNIKFLQIKKDRKEYPKTGLINSMFPGWWRIFDEESNKEKIHLKK